VISNGRVLYLDCQTPPHAMAVSVPPGWTLPIHATSLGKSMLAFMPEDERTQLLDLLPFEAMTPNTITDRARLLDSLEEIRRERFAIDRGEVRLDVSCAAAPLIDRLGYARAAISVTGPSANLPANWETTFSAAVRDAAADISRACFGADQPGFDGAKG